MKFRYYITDPYDGSVEGTDFESVAYKFVENDYYVLDSDTGEWMQPAKIRVPIKEVKQ